MQPRELRGPFDASLLAIGGVAGLFSGDGSGLSESRDAALRTIGRFIGIAFSIALLFAAYRVLRQE